MKPSFQIQHLEQLYKLHQPALLRYANGFLRSSEDAREVVQDVFMAVWRNRSDMDLKGNLKAYLYKATRNKCLNFLQKRRLSVVSLDANPVEQGRDENIEAEMEAAELQAAIASYIQQLPPKCREIFLISREEGLSYKEIAERLDISVKTVENQIGIALKKLRERLFAEHPSARHYFGIWLILTFISI